MPIKLYELVGSDPARPFSPHCWKVRMALAHKRLDFETVPVRFTEIPAIANGGFKIVPVLAHGARHVSDSFDIALYLRDTYPDRGADLFRGEGAIALSRFIESWSFTQIHDWITRWALLDIVAMLDPADAAYFRESRTARLGMPLEDIVANREATIPELMKRLTPLRHMLARQPFVGGSEPRFADFIVFGAFQWLRIVSGLHMIPADDPVRSWIERMLDLNDGMARQVPEAGA